MFDLLSVHTILPVLLTICLREKNVFYREREKKKKIVKYFRNYASRPHFQDKKKKKGYRRP